MTSQTVQIQDTKLVELKRIFQLQKDFQYELAKRPISARKKQLSKLENALKRYRKEIQEALYKDFRKHPVEVNLAEILPVIMEIKHVKRNLRKWARPKVVDTPLSLIGSKSYIHYEPKGVSLIIAPWNFPIFLTFGPLVAAIAAGCPAILKPSESTVYATRVMKKIISECFEEREVALVEGTENTSIDLLTMPFNHIYFTGAPSIGKLIMKAASVHLASVTLELGGKSPAIIDESANLTAAAKRIAMTKFMNAGQVCIATDYLLVHSKVKDKFLEKIKECIVEFYGENAQDSSSYPRIVNSRHYERLMGYFEDGLEKGMKIEHGGKVDAEQDFIDPTIVSNLPDDATLLQEEIFGPILPLIEFSKIEEAVKYIQKKEKPLALYIYSKNKKNINYIINNTRAGGTVVNHSMIHILNNNLPFGGSNNSGIGKGIGHYGFLAFSNERAIVKQRLFFSSLDLLSPPYTGFKQRILDLTERFLS